MAEHDAMMVFGDEAVGCAGRDGFEPALDLGEAWPEWTGLPFVFAVWAVQRAKDEERIAKSEERGPRVTDHGSPITGLRPPATDHQSPVTASTTALADRLRRAKAEGLAHLEEIVRTATEATPEIRREYLTRHIQYDVGAAEKAGLRRFQELLVELQLVEGHELRFIS